MYVPTRLYDIATQQTVCTLADCVEGRWCYCDPSTKPDDWKGNTNDMAAVYEPAPKLIASATTAAQLDDIADAIIAGEPPCPWLAPCGCGWTRCAVHQPMMERIHDVWNRPLSAEQWAAVDAECDGFGPGSGSHGDWSGVRDSSPEAVERMYAAAERFAKFVR